MKPEKRGAEKTVAWLIMGGLLLACLSVTCSIPLTVVGFGNLALLAWVAALPLGILLFLVGLGLGLAKSMGVWPKATTGMVEDAYVVSVQVLNRHHLPVWNESAFHPSEIRRFVQFRTPDGRIMELEVDSHQLEGIGEGARGELTFSGEHLVTFVPRPPEGRLAWVDPLPAGPREDAEVPRASAESEGPGLP